MNVILISGDLAAGKSTFANYLSETLFITCINKDVIKEILGDHFGFKNREENLNLSYTTFDIMYYILQKSIKANESIILESNFRQNEIDKIYDLCEKFKINTVSIYISGELKVLHERFMHRILYENRHEVHKSQDLSKLEDFAKVAYSNRSINYKGKLIKLDSTDFKPLYEENTIKEIKALMN